MNFSIRTLMLNVTYIAIAIAAWISDSELFLSLVTLFFVILILRTVACSLIAIENRAYWLGSTVISCGLLLTSPYLFIFDAIANYEDTRRHAMYAYPVTLLPSPTSLPTSVPPSNPPVYSPSTGSAVPTWLPPPSPIYPTPIPLAASFSFRFAGGYSAVFKVFLVTVVAYLAGTVAGVICAKVFVEDKKSELLDATN